MESIIKWQTGEPKESGLYIVSVSNKIGEKGITVLNWDNKYRNFLFITLYPDLTVYAWCKLNDIKPYKEETK